MSRTRKNGTRSREERHTEAVKRNTNFASLSFTEQLQYLDLRLGEGVGAIKQRAKIQNKKAKQKKRAKKKK